MNEITYYGFIVNVKPEYKKRFKSGIFWTSSYLEWQDHIFSLSQSKFYDGIVPMVTTSPPENLGWLWIKGRDNEDREM